ncbi:MAG: hypothetical protein A6F71_00675 [Cycloclasticus sp. symbiont of Poecilosclerida sp. M]|nr:MAG: hypothetical protein A6F71_00675 [Cycloclasticus sp. symbiont of Poecilosclerida sp. M]
MSWIKAVLTAIDQLGNAIAGGNPRATISARTGYFANVHKNSFRVYWKTMEFVIDFAFCPIDGPRHCYESYLLDVDRNNQEGSDWMRGILGLIILIACSLIAILTRLYVIFVPSAKISCDDE